MFLAAAPDSSSTLTLLGQILGIVVVLGTSIATLATLKQQAKDSERRHSETKKSVETLACEQAETNSRVQVVSERVDRYCEAEDERHESVCKTLGDIRDEVKDHGKDITSLRLWQAEESGLAKAEERKRRRSGT